MNFKTGIFAAAMAVGLHTNGNDVTSYKEINSSDALTEIMSQEFSTHEAILDNKDLYVFLSNPDVVCQDENGTIIKKVTKGNIKNIVSVEIGENVSSIPMNDIAELSGIEELIVKSSSVTKLPEAWSFPHLKHLIISQPNISQLPGWVSECKELTILDINNTSIPAVDIVKLPKTLELLYMKKVRIIYNIDSIVQLGSLKKIHINTVAMNAEKDQDAFSTFTTLFFDHPTLNSISIKDDENLKARVIPIFDGRSGWNLVSNSFGDSDRYVYTKPQY